MCGIFGIIAHHARVPDDVLERATRSLAHRGPDDSGTVILRDNDSVEIGLGNRRLAILDLSPLGHQPMSDPSTGNWIVYNGEVYNFREVRSKLEREGLHFSGGSPIPKSFSRPIRSGEKNALPSSVACSPSPSGTLSAIASSSRAIPWASSRFISTARIATLFFLLKFALCSGPASFRIPSIPRVSSII